MSSWRPSPGYLAAALLLAVGAASLAFFVWYFARDDAAAGAGQTPAPASVAAAGRPASVATAASAVQRKDSRHPMQPAPEGDADPTRDLRSYVMRGEKPTMNEVIKRLHEQGIHTGLGAFNPPGTNPPLVGLAVPKDFALPPGYVRHHQVTDDGQAIEPILMFAPDFQLYDTSNRPLEMPKDRVVPPELAPPGLPLRRIAIPPPIDTSGR
ncbi:hypothetical protein [Duganella sp. Root1480D1]|uniref:hypothetical protein n=1 Tax=Duganella sp. Root1480D1 TaxID=1736471 RepID=UPI00070D87BE|nr:hypothetical protein [Duganella sp. Root1480D1]KQZ28154.1 hypothetical protein ASD58_11990 [Duganella sp. Root1480D1]